MAKTDEGNIFVKLSRESFMWGSFDPEIRGVPAITHEGAEFDASHRNSVEEKAEKAGVVLDIEER